MSKVSASFAISHLGIRLGDFLVRVDGKAVTSPPTRITDDCIIWLVDGYEISAGFTQSPLGHLQVSIKSASPTPRHSLGIVVRGITGVRSYLRNGYTSWDGSAFVELAQGEHPCGHAMTALLPSQHEPGALVIGFVRHDRFQTELGFTSDGTSLDLALDCLIDGVAGPHDCGAIVFIRADDIEDGLRTWSRHVSLAASPPPRVRGRRITGWCSWYNLYATITEPILLKHLKAASAFRDAHQAPLDVFLIDDGFTPEMGDWLKVKPQFPNGMKPLVSEIAEEGFIPGLWIAPFMVGNRSDLFCSHPDWVVKDRRTGAPWVHMRFYGEFRWHKSSEEYYCLDITHPDAYLYMQEVLRTWVEDWGIGYLKTDFMHFGSDLGSDKVVWHQAGLTRIDVWRRMAELIRNALGDRLWLGCGCPLWASVGYVDAVRIGKDVGVRWTGDQSAQSLLRDQMTRNHGNGILWQSDPDCVLLRERFHDLSDAQVESLALFAGLSGGVLMTSDLLSELSPERARLFASLLKAEISGCDFPALGDPSTDGSTIIKQVAKTASGGCVMSSFNAGPAPCQSLAGYETSIVLDPHTSNPDILALLEGKTP